MKFLTGQGEKLFGYLIKDSEDLDHHENFMHSISSIQHHWNNFLISYDCYQYLKVTFKTIKAESVKFEYRHVAKTRKEFFGN